MKRAPWLIGKWLICYFVGGESMLMLPLLSPLMHHYTCTPYNVVDMTRYNSNLSRKIISGLKNIYNIENNHHNNIIGITRLLIGLVRILISDWELYFFARHNSKEYNVVLYKAVRTGYYQFHILIVTYQQPSEYFYYDLRKLFIFN